MSTTINVTSGGDALLNRAKTQQQAGRLAAAEQKRQRQLEAERATRQSQQDAERQPKRQEPAPYRRDPAAFVPLQGGVVGLEFTTLIPFSGPSMTLKVGTPGMAAFAEVSGIADPTYKTAQNLPPTASTSSGVGAPFGIRYYNTTLGLWEAWSDLGPGGAGTSNNFYTGATEPPTSSWTQVQTPFQRTFSTDKSQSLVLPVSRDTCIFLYVHNKLKLINVYARKVRTDRTCLNARSESGLAANLSNGTWYDGTDEGTTRYQFDHTDTYANYEVLAFVVGRQAVRQIEVPTALAASIQELYPPVDANTTSSFILRSGNGVYYPYGPPTYSQETTGYTIGPEYQSEPSFSDSTWLAGRRYGSYTEDQAALAKQFGLGYFDLINGSHRGPFYTPAVYRFLQGGMTLGASSTEYAYMRESYMQSAPLKFLGPCQLDSSCTTESVGFDVTQQQPTTIYSAVDQSLFRAQRQYSVDLNGQSRYGLLYAWDWDKPAYCRQQLLALGFTPADLVP